MPISTAADYVVRSNKMFLLEMKSASELDSRVITLIPTIVFMIGTFTLIFKAFHRRTHRSTPLRIKFYRVNLIFLESSNVIYYFQELGFHWTYFYLIRIWFLIIKIFKWGSIKLNNYVEVSNSWISLNIFSVKITISEIWIYKEFLLRPEYCRRIVPTRFIWL